MSSTTKKEGEGPKVINMGGEAPPLTKAQQQEQVRQQQERHKQMERDLNDYKKRITKGNEMKRLQVEEIRLNIDYYKAKREYIDLAPDIEKLEAEEAKLLAEEQEKQKEAMKAMREKMEKEKKEQEEEKPKIVVPKVGKPRSETEKK